MHGTRGNRDAGLTLVELVVALIIILAMAGAAASVFGPTVESNRLRNSAAELLSAIRFAHQMAHDRASLGSGIEYRVNFLNAQAYELQEVDPTHAPAVAAMSQPGALIGWYTHGLGERVRLGPSLGPQTLATAPVDPESERIHFANAQGQILVPTGAPGEAIRFFGVARPPDLPRSGPMVFDRIVITARPTPTTPGGYATQIIRLGTWTGTTSLPRVAWMELASPLNFQIP